eukprot:3039947-Amphidinium_carterae.4
MVRSLRDIWRALIYLVFDIPIEEIYAVNTLLPPLRLLREHLMSMHVNAVQWIGPTCTLHGTQLNSDTTPTHERELPVVSGLVVPRSQDVVEHRDSDHDALR